MRAFLVVASSGVAPLPAALSLAAFSLAIGCGGGVTEVGGPSLGGSGGTGAAGGMAGSASLGGSGGGGGSGATVALSDAGPDGSTGSGGGSAGFTYPAGCPVPAPVAAKPEQRVVIQSVNLNTSEIVLKNVSNTTVVMKNTPPRTGWQWCNFPAYWDIADVDVTLEPGQTFKFFPVYNTSGVRPFYADQGELGIYTVSGSFDESNLIENFVSWGTGVLGGREYVATMADVWTGGEHIDVGNNAGFIATGNVKRASGFTAVPARCLVAPPNQ